MKIQIQNICGLFLDVSSLCSSEIGVKIFGDNLDENLNRNRSKTLIKLKIKSSKFKIILWEDKNGSSSI